MADTSSVRERAAAVLTRANRLDIPSIDPDLFEAGVLHSLARVERLLQIAHEFGIRTSVGDLEADNLESIACIADFVSARVALEPGTAEQR